MFGVEICKSLMFSPLKKLSVKCWKVLEDFYNSDFIHKR